MCYIIFNGIKFATQKDFIAYKKANFTKSKKSRKRASTSTSSEYREVAAYVATLLRGIKTCKSLNSYKDNGYRQWGNNCKFVLNMEAIKQPFETFQKAYKLAQKTLDKVNEESKRGSKAVFQYLQVLTWNIEDMGQAVRSLYEGISKSGVLQSPMANEELIAGEGRRLGLATLVRRSWSTCNNMDNIIKVLQAMCDKH